jgi:hypothetical protein
MKLSLLFVAAVLCCADQTSAEQISLANRGGFELHSTQAETVIYRDRHALKLTEKRARRLAKLEVVNQQARLGSPATPIGHSSDATMWRSQFWSAVLPCCLWVRFIRSSFLSFFCQSQS